MAEFGVEMHGSDDIDSALKHKAETAIGGTNDELRDLAEDILDEIEATAPVDTGEYKSSWRIEEISEGEVWLVNDAEHAPYLVFPNSWFREIGVGNSVGILHNVKAIVYSYRTDIIGRLKHAFRESL